MCDLICDVYHCAWPAKLHHLLVATPNKLWLDVCDQVIFNWWSWCTDVWMVVNLTTLPFTVLPETTPFHWAESTARTTSPTRHVRALANCWSVRLEQSLGPCPQPECHRSCFHAPAKTFMPARSALRTLVDDVLFKWTRWQWLIVTKLNNTGKYTTQ